jgi:hypothetical protein
MLKIPLRIITDSPPYTKTMEKATNNLQMTWNAWLSCVTVRISRDSKVLPNRARGCYLLRRPFLQNTDPASPWKLKPRHVNCLSVEVQYHSFSVCSCCITKERARGTYWMAGMGNHRAGIGLAHAVKFFLHRLTVDQLAKTSPSCVWHPNVRYRVQNRPPLTPSHSKTNIIRIIQTYSGRSSSIYRRGKGIFS